MEIKDVLINGGTLVIDPAMTRITPDEFLALYGSYMDSICLVAKSENGATYYPSYTAPKDPTYSEFFSSFAHIASDIGIKVYALLHSNVDYYLSRDPNFQMYRSGGIPIEGYVCPARQNYWYYLSEVAAEVAKFPIEGIILKDSLYPRDAACFCENCRREFSNENMVDRDFSLEQLARNNDIFAKWSKRRVDSLSGMVSSVVSRVHGEKKIEIMSEIVVDPQTSYLDGAAHHFGQNITNLSHVTTHLLLHLFPWGGDLPSADSEEFNELIDQLSPVKELADTHRNSLFLWGTSDQHIELANQVK